MYIVFDFLKGQLKVVCIYIMNAFKIFMGNSSQEKYCLKRQLCAKQTRVTFSKDCRAITKSMEDNLQSQV